MSKIDIDEIISAVHELSSFNIIGFTEKELGASTLERMKNIALFRKALDEAGLEMPIHIFGSLDTISTPLYFLSGADIFDGLTWLRYAFHEGKTIYKHNYGSSVLGVSYEYYKVNAKVWNDNYHYLFRLKEDMRKFLVEGDFARFRHNGALFESACALLRQRTEGR